MAPATEITVLTAGLSAWQAYTPTVKADLCSSALATPTGLFLVDPIPLKTDALGQMIAHHEVAGIVITNENHERAAIQYARKFDVPIFIDVAVREADSWPGRKPLSTAELACPGLAAISLPGGPAGETALVYSEDRGTLIIGDALINFEPHGFSLLPAKYCDDHRQMRRSLEQLLRYRFERILFAHGTPIVANAHSRLEQLLSAAA